MCPSFTALLKKCPAGMLDRLKAYDLVMPLLWSTTFEETEGTDES